MTETRILRDLMLSALKRISTAKVHSDLHADDEARWIADSYATTSVKRPRRSDMFHIKSVEIYRTQGHPYLGDLSTLSSNLTI
jgi:GTP:adenosylcobinamide-phosphate guanylyltransferase